MKIAIEGGNAKWVVRAIAEDYKKHTSLDVVTLRDNPDVVWAVNFWSLPAVVKKFKNVVAQLHHVNESQIGEYNFSLLDKCKACIVPNEFTYNFVKGRTKTKVVQMPYWLLSVRMGEAKKKKRARRIREGGEIIIGSFQKDSESGTGKPKMVKGPDMLIDVLSKLRNIKVVLAGYNREYVIKQLESKKIPFEYYQMDNDLNSLYDSLDWYLVTSRVEGGPQAILEATYRKIKVLSTPVGMAPEVLHPDCLCDDADEFVTKITENVDRTEENYVKIQDYLPNKLVDIYDKFFIDIGR